MKDFIVMGFNPLLIGSSEFSTIPKLIGRLVKFQSPLDRVLRVFKIERTKLAG